MKTKVTELGQQSGPIAGQNRKQGEVIDLLEDEAHRLHAAGFVDIQKPSRLDQLKQADQAASEAAKALESTDTKSGEVTELAVPSTVIESDPALTPASQIADDTTKAVTVKKKN